MLAGKVSDVDKLTYPRIATPKLDGIRCIIKDGKPVSRKFKDIPNRHVQRVLAGLPDGLDGELMVDGTFQDVSSAIMGREGEPKFSFQVFDYECPAPYRERLGKLRDIVETFEAAPLVYVPTTFVQDGDELLRYEEKVLGDGYEGVMLRTPDGPYKCGRSTEREGYLLKLKRFSDGEALVIGLEEMMHNDNVAEKDAFGRTKRSHAQAGMRPAGTLGRFLVRDIATGVDFEIGTGQGLTAALRKEIWTHQAAYVGKVVKYKSQPTGVKDKPRFPVWLGFREAGDL
jgi:DNA ligase-1